MLPLSIIKKWCDTTDPSILDAFSLDQINLNSQPELENLKNSSTPFTDHTLSKPTQKQHKGGFYTFGLSQPVLDGVTHMYKVPTPIQNSTIPLLLNGHDTVAMARTGSGKTAAFLIPLLEKLISHSSSYGVRGLIISPSHELANQTLEFLTKLGKFTDLRAALLVGGESLSYQIELLLQNPDIIVASPGRLLHLLLQIPTFTLSKCEYVVIDEADAMFERELGPQIFSILDHLPKTKRQIALISATLPAVLVDFVKAGLRNPKFIRLDVEHKLSPTLKLNFRLVRNDSQREAMLLSIISSLNDAKTIIFIASRQQADYLSCLISTTLNKTSRLIHGHMDQFGRHESLLHFKGSLTQTHDGQVLQPCNILIMTDLGARGIDVPVCENVIHFDFPPEPTLFIHRSGRVARAGRPGACWSIISLEDIPFMFDVFLFLNLPLETFFTHKELSSIRISSIGKEIDSENSITSEESNQLLIDFDFPEETAILPFISTIENTLSVNSSLQVFREGRDKAMKKYKKLRQSPTRFGLIYGKQLKTKIFDNSGPTWRPDPKANKNVVIVPQLSSSTTKKATPPQSTPSKSQRKKLRKKNRKQTKKKKVTVDPNAPSQLFQENIMMKRQDIKERESNSINRVIMDIVGDDADSLRSMNRNKVWDPHKRRYVMKDATKAWHVEKKSLTGQVFNEAGVRINKMKPGEKATLTAYQKWVKQRNPPLPSIGTKEEGPHVEQVSISLNKYEKRYRHRGGKGPRQDVNSFGVSNSIRQVRNRNE